MTETGARRERDWGRGGEGGRYGLLGVHVRGRSRLRACDQGGVRWVGTQGGLQPAGLQYHVIVTLVQAPPRHVRGGQRRRRRGPGPPKRWVRVVGGGGEGERLSNLLETEPGRCHLRRQGRGGDEGEGGSGTRAPGRGAIAAGVLGLRGRGAPRGVRRTAGRRAADGTRPLKGRRGGRGRPGIRLTAER
jgi:hypothetical protein